MDTDFDPNPKATDTFPELEEVCARFEAWREAKPRANSPIPDVLWEAAVALVGPRHCPAAVAKALRLDPGRLTAKAIRSRSGGPVAKPDSFPVTSTDPRCPPQPVRTPVAPAFVEMALRSFAAPTPAAPAYDPRHEPRVIIEIRLPDGTSLKVSQREPLDTAGFFNDILDNRR